MSDISLIKTTVEDIDNIMSWVNDPNVVARIANIKYPISKKDELEWLNRVLVDNNARFYSILVDGVYAGQASLPQIHWPSRNARLALILKKEFHGRHIASTATKKLFEIAFNELKLHKLWCLAIESNKKTVGLFTKCGMVQEAKLIDEYYLDGQFHNMLRFYMTEDMWETCRQ